MLNTVHTVSMSATGYTPWVDLRRVTNASIQTSCGDVNDPVGVLTVEVSNDAATIEKELNNGTTPANSAAALVSVAPSVTGDSWANGYNGTGAKASIGNTSIVNTAAFARVKYTRTSGGAGDTLTVRWFGKLGYA